MEIEFPGEQGTGIVLLTMNRLSQGYQKTENTVKIERKYSEL